MVNKKPKIIFWDIETSPIISTTWNLYPTSIPPENIIQDWFILCGAWKELGSKEVNAVWTKVPTDDYTTVKKLRDSLANADIIVHHNGDKFDIKKLNARLIYHQLDPLPLIPCVDTLKEIKKVATFTSHRLDYLAKILTGSGKLHVGYELWQKAFVGNRQALKEMVEYCKVDVVKLEQLYNAIRPYMKSHPHIGAMSGKDRFDSCPKCGSNDFKRNGTKYTAAGVAKQECQCKKCHGYFKIPLSQI